MPEQRRWTLLVVPHGSDSPRSISISRRGLRAIAAVAGGFGSIGVLCTAAVVAQLVIPGLRMDFWRDRARRANVEALQARIDSMADTLDVISRRDEQIRLLAGLPPVNSDPFADDSNTFVADGMVESQPAVDRIGPSAGTEVEQLIRRANSLAASFAEVSDTLAMHVDRMAHTPSIMPTAGWLSSAFSKSRFHTIQHIRRPHDGIDVSAPMGAPIVAPAAGTVILVGREQGYGNILEIDHGNGIVTKYAHCSRIFVRRGQHVKRGQEIAAVGNTGLSTGPHLHYEIHVNGKVVDPLTYVLPGGAIPD
jgi:biotin carboxyl carrier protein